MPTDPFVAPARDAEPRQEPNLAPGARLPAPHRWRADRPGDLADGVQPRGPLFGSPGPNVGYAVLLVRRRASELVLGPHERREDAEAVVAALAMKRAASLGRAPVVEDVECAAIALGYLGAPAPGFVAWRERAVTGASHEYEVRRAVCDAVPLDELRRPPAALAGRAGELHERLMASVAT